MPAEKARPHQHAGVEFLYVLKGQLALRVAGRGSPSRRRRLRLLPLDASPQLPENRRQALLGPRRVRAVTAAPRPSDRRFGIRRRPAARGARTARRAVALLRPPARVPCAAARRLHRDRRRRRARLRVRRPGPRGRFDRLLPDPLDGRRGLRRARPGGGPRFSARPHARRVSAGSSTSAVSERARRPLANTCAAARRRARSSRQSGVPVVEFRASIVLGSGSLSFEMVRALVERLPVMICPRWVAVEAQPIADRGRDRLPGRRRSICRTAPSASTRSAAPDRVTYGDLMREYARQRGLKRVLIPVPLLTPRLSSLWLGLVTPLYARVGRKLVDSLRNPTVVRDPAALAAFPVRPRGVRDAIARALAQRRRGLRENALVGRRVLVGSDRPLWRRSRRHAPGRQPHDVRSGGAGRRVCADPADRRRRRLVLRKFSLATARVPGPARRGRRPAPRAPPPRRALPGRCSRLLAGRGLRARSAAAAARRDEGAGPCVAAVRDDAGSGRHRDPADRQLRRRPGSSASPTGTRCTRSTASFSPACSAPSRTALGGPRRLRRLARSAVAHEADDDDDGNRNADQPQQYRAHRQILPAGRGTASMSRSLCFPPRVAAKLPQKAPTMSAAKSQ